MRGILTLCGLAFVLAACSSASGGGSSPANPQVIVVPQGTSVVCTNGKPPPCS